MRKIKITLFQRLLLLLTFISTSNIIYAQSVDEALRNLDVEKLGAATSTIKKVIEKNPKDARNYFYAGYIYINLEKPDSAKVFFDQGIGADPKEALNYVGQGYLALNNGKIQEAQGLFDKALSLSKEKDAVVFNKIADALIHAETKDANKALTYLQRALPLKKGKDDAAKIDSETQLLMGDAYMQINDGGKAASAYDRATTLDPKLAKAYVRMGRIYLIPKNADAAEEQFNKAVQVDPEYAPVYLDLGELYFTYRKNLAKAREAYQKYMQLSDVKTGSRSRYAIFTYLTKDYPTAVTELTQALTSEPNNLVLNRLLGYSLYETGAYQESKDAMDKYFAIVKPDKTLAKDFETYGKALIKLGQDSLAISNINRAIEIDTANIVLLSDIGDEYRKSKKFKEASKLYQQVLKKKKVLVTNDHYNLGLSCLYSQQLTCADTAFSNVIKLAPDNYVGYVMLANVRSQQDPEGKKGLAKPFYEKAVPILEKDTTGKDFIKKYLVQSYLYLGYQAYLQNEMSTSKSFLEKLRGIDPNNEKIATFEELLNPKPAPAPKKKPTK